MIWIDSFTKDARSCAGNIVLIFSFLLYVSKCAGHGRLIEPPSRASAWRYGFQTPPDYNDHELYCGGFTRQWKQNEGRCGECGDAWDLAEPRPHEYGGLWGQGVIVRRYSPRADIIIRVELTASHMGYFEFRLCPEPDAKQDCLDRHLLKLLGGSPSQHTPTDLETRFYPRNGSRIYEIKAQLPDIKCTQCLLQWRYIAGNNWGICPDGQGAVGCGPQEEFRGCSDIAIGEGVRAPIRPLRPTSRPTTRPKGYQTSTETTQKDEQADDSSSVTSLVVGLLVFLIVCILATWFTYRFYGIKLEKWMETTAGHFCWRQNKDSPHPQSGLTSASAVTANVSPVMAENIGIEPVMAPIPPPRTKRSAQVKELSAEVSSVA